MVNFFETKNFIVCAHDKPHVTRTDGGHIKITPKKNVENRWDFNAKLAIELMRLSMIVGKAMKIGLNKRGINVERINFQDNGNWAYFLKQKSFFHLHLYGRTKNSKYQRKGQALSFPDCNSKFYDKTKPLNNCDIKEIKKQIMILSKQKKYNLNEWNID
jgi:diadenosine tetraphosphate (Ap4A) HIT family hydrolase